MDNNWTKIISTSDSIKAEMIKGFLTENEIETFLLNKKDSSYHFGEVEIYVQAENALKAKHLINSNNLL
ncbi:MAG: DUF2007 domain-containing protein [Bacteroidales bacterium]|nr:DUF2007 domain-containing protein [Bacteroidales bacterium]MCF8403630.1 DUF2007 domain-containing protein [Bacteroidales bacterium]